MNKFFFAAAIMAITCGANASDFGDLAVKASGLKTSAVETGIDPMPPATPANSGRTKGLKWYGSDSRRTRLEFTSYMYYEIPSDYTGPASRILEDQTQKWMIQQNLDLQVQHMYGVFTMHPDFENNPGIPSGDYRTKILGAEKVPNEPYVKVSYEYSDIAVFAKSLFSGGIRQISFVLPKDPVTIYGKGMSAGVNKCTDEHYNSEGDFWYFWNPYQEGCPIKGSELVKVRADVSPMNSTTGTYPDYKALYGDNGNGEVFEIAFLVGVDENFRNGDMGKQTFKDAFAALKEAGFTVTVDEPRRKRLSLRAGDRRTSLVMYLAEPGSAEFEKLAVQGMKNSDVFLYDGHSGLGGYLDPTQLAGGALSLPVDKYQIFAFHGCSTYAYYNSGYFKLKKTSSDPKGTKNLDIITTGIGAAFEVGAKSDVALITDLAGGERPSWQTIIDNIHAAEGDSSALTHVNGDEDNPRKP
jgi:hypothetical protein